MEEATDVTVGDVKQNLFVGIYLASAYRRDHAKTGALLPNRVLPDSGMKSEAVAKVIVAI